MLASLNDLLAPPVMQRLMLLVNHVLAAEPAAVDRLRPFAGRALAIDLERWPGLLPPPPPLVFTITPAGLFEWGGMAPAATDAALRIGVDAANPAGLMLRAIAGETPPVTVDGDAQLATEVNWLLTNLRWDVGADLERLFGPALALPLHRLGSLLARGLRGTLEGADRVAARWRSRAP